MNFMSHGVVDGYCAEVVRAIVQRAGLDAPISILPWARAYKLAQTQPNVGVFCTGRNLDREDLFQWVGPLINVITRFYANADSPLQIKTIADAREAEKVIVVQESFSSQLLRNLGFNNVVLANSAADALRQLKVSGGRALLLTPAMSMVEDMGVMRQQSSTVKPMLSMVRNQAYVAFSLDTAPGLIERLQGSLDKMKADGSFAALYRKWFPGEKPPGIEPEPDSMAP